MLISKFYRVAICSALLYGTEYWPVKKILKNKLKVTEMLFAKVDAQEHIDGSNYEPRV